MPRRVRKAPYSRVGCLTCKSRHKKCDGNKPECNTCLRLGMICRQSDEFRNHKAPSNVALASISSAGLEGQCFTFSAAASPSTHPQSTTEGPSDSETTTNGGDISSFGTNTPDNWYNEPSSRSPSISQLIFSPDDQITSLFTVEREHLDVLEAQASPEEYLIPGKIDSFSDLSHSDWQNYQYYVEKMSDLILNGHAPQNPLRVVAIPRIMSSPVLLQAVCSISAQHRANSSLKGRAQYQRAADLYYLRALSSLKNMIPYVMYLQTSAGYHDPEALEHILLISIFLCKHEIIKSGVANWRAHLAGVELFSQFLEDHGSCSTETIMYARSFVQYHRTIASITEETIMKVGNAHHKPHMEEYPCDSARYVIDPYMGLSQDLISALHRVTRLSGFPVCEESQQVALQCEIMSIIQVVKERSWNLKLAFKPVDMSPASIINLIHIARAYEHAIFAYLHSVIDDLAAGDINHLALWQDLHAQIPASRSAAIADCLKEMDEVPVNSPEEPGLLPLLFIISCIAENAEDTWVILNRVKLLATNFCLGNMNSISSFLGEIWSRRMDSTQSDAVGWRKLLANSKWDLMLC